MTLAELREQCARIAWDNEATWVQDAILDIQLPEERDPKELVEACLGLRKYLPDVSDAQGNWRYSAHCLAVKRLVDALAKWERK